MSLDKSLVYDELLCLKLELNYSDVPTPSYIQTLIINCNNYQRKVEKYFIESTRELSYVEKLFRTEKLSLETKKRHALINNERIKKLPTGKERESAVDGLLEKDYETMLSLENEAASLRDLLTAIKTVQYNLKATNSDIKMLLKIMDQQINRLNIGHPEDPEMKNLIKDLGDLDKLDEEMTAEDIESATESQEESDDQVIEVGTENQGTPAEGVNESTVDSEDFINDSFLSDDPSSIDEEGSSENGEEPATTEEPTEEPVTQSIPPKVTEVKKTTALEDMDFDIDFGDTQDAPSKKDPVKVVKTPVQSEIKTEVKPEVKPDIKAPPVPPVEDKKAKVTKPEAVVDKPKKEDTGIDIEELLLSLDE